MIADLHDAMRRHYPALAGIALFSVFVNLLMLTGPLFMLQVYDRVLASRSEPTLVALFLLVAGLFAAMALLDAVRNAVGSRIGAQLQSDLDGRVFAASLNAPPHLGREAATAVSDLEALRKFVGSPLCFAFFDLPFAPLFFAAIFLFHPLLGWLSLGGGLLLLLLMLANQTASRRPSDRALQSAAAANRTFEQLRSQPETVRGLGMTAAAIARWRRERDTALAADVALADRNSGFGSTVRAVRLFLQSAILALGAWLVIRGELTGGAMVASSILMGRALAPVEQLVTGWAAVGRVRRAWTALSALLAAVRPPPARTRLGTPEARLDLREVTLVPPGETKPTLARVSFQVGPGQALGVIGESASGKSSLARAITGVWPVAGGEIRLSGARIDQYEESDLARYIGYLPQDVALFDGSVAENIARLQAGADAERIIAAATLAGAHEMILKLPKGYDTPVGASGAKLSGGQKQRIGLARALFGDPVVVVLDEPNSNLDAAGSDAVNAAIRALKARGCIVIIMAHRPAAIAECDLLLMMRGGQVGAFGPRDEVLKRIVANHGQIALATARQSGNA
jgi:ATP-binding cassette subfamily C protein